MCRSTVVRCLEEVVLLCRREISIQYVDNHSIECLSPHVLYVFIKLPTIDLLFQKKYVPLQNQKCNNMKSKTKYFRFANFCLCVLIALLFESCGYCSYLYELKSEPFNNYGYASAYGDDTRFLSSDSLLVNSDLDYSSTNIKTVFVGKDIHYEIEIETFLREKQSYSADTIILNGFVITDGNGDTLQATTGWNLFFNENGEYKIESGEVDTLPYTFILDGDYLPKKHIWPSLDIEKVSKNKRRMPKVLFVSYDLTINNEVFSMKNIKYEWCISCCGFRSISHYFLVPIFSTIGFFIPM